MGNCQAVDAATLVIEYPSGKIDKFYWPVTAGHIMKMNPGLYVALLLSTTATAHSLRITRIKLLRPTDYLVLGHVYRLVTTEEVLKGLWAKKQAKQKRNLIQSGLTENPDRFPEIKHASSGLDIGFQPEKNHQVTKIERNRRLPTAENPARSRTWQPSLHSISEAARLF